MRNSFWLFKCSSKFQRRVGFQGLWINKTLRHLLSVYDGDIWERCDMEILKIFVLTCIRICLPVVADVLFDDPRSLSSIFYVLFQYIYSTSTGEFTFLFMAFKCVNQIDYFWGIVLLRFVVLPSCRLIPPVIVNVIMWLDSRVICTLFGAVR